MMDNLANYCLHLSRSKCVSYWRAIRLKYDNMSILRGVAPYIRTDVVTQIIRMPPNGVIWFEFQINVDRGNC